MPSATRGLAALTDLVLPVRCLGCRATDSSWCAACRPSGAPFAVTGPALGGHLDVPVVAACRYDAATRRVLLHYKERGRRDLARPLAGLLADAVRTATVPTGELLLVAPPTPADVAAARGGDHVLRLARRVAVATGARVAPGSLVATRRVADSAGLGVAERRRNLAGSMRARAPARPAAPAVLLVDDIVTTGATLGEAARALRAAGHRVVGAAVVAATPRRVLSGPLAVPRSRV